MWQMDGGFEKKIEVEKERLFVSLMWETLHPFLVCCFGGGNIVNGKKLQKCIAEMIVGWYNESIF